MTGGFEVDGSVMVSARKATAVRFGSRKRRSSGRSHAQRTTDGRASSLDAREGAGWTNAKAAAAARIDSRTMAAGFVGWRISTIGNASFWPTRSVDFRIVILRGFSGASKPTNGMFRGSHSRRPVIRCLGGRLVFKRWRERAPPHRIKIWLRAACGPYLDFAVFGEYTHSSL